jgi:hypothetical protein
MKISEIVVAHILNEVHGELKLIVENDHSKIYTG